MVNWKVKTETKQDLKWMAWAYLGAFLQCIIIYKFPSGFI